MTELHSVKWNSDDRSLDLIDQTLLPAEFATIPCTRVSQLLDAIGRLAVRGAPALGVAGAFGVAVAMIEGEREGWSDEQLREAVDAIRNARPTAVNLAWAVDRVRPHMTDGIDAVLVAAAELLAQDQEANRALVSAGADWVMARVTRRPIRALTHCNTGSLATSGRGSALGIIRELHDRGVLERVFVDETRPLLQGSRLTAWELQRYGIPYVVQTDGAATSTILRELVDVAVVGADRIARNGDTANKIGTVGVALACHVAGIPFVVAAPASTVDLATLSGDDIEIELRPGDEVTRVAGVLVAPAEAVGFNPAFDVTPGRYISAIATEHAVVEPSITPDVSALLGSSPAEVAVSGTTIAV